MVPFSEGFSILVGFQPCPGFILRPDWVPSLVDKPTTAHNLSSSRARSLDLRFRGSLVVGGCLCNCTPQRRRTSAIGCYWLNLKYNLIICNNLFSPSRARARSRSHSRPRALCLLRIHSKCRSMYRARLHPPSALVLLLLLHTRRFGFVCVCVYSWECNSRFNYENKAALLLRLLLLS